MEFMYTKDKNDNLHYIFYGKFTTQLFYSLKYISFIPQRNIRQPLVFLSKLTEDKIDRVFDDDMGFHLYRRR